MTRTYHRTSPETLSTLLEACNGSIRAVKDGEDACSPNTINALLSGLPQGSLTAARFDIETNLVAFSIRGRPERFVEPEAFLLIRMLAIFAPGGVYIDKNQTGKERRDYVKVKAAGRHGITLLRLLADAQQGEKVEQAGDHHNLSAACLLPVTAPKGNERGRREALEAALAAFDNKAGEWEMTSLLSREGYRQILKGCFLVYDIKHGHHRLTAARAA